MAEQLLVAEPTAAGPGRSTPAAARWRSAVFLLALAACLAAVAVLVMLVAPSAGAAGGCGGG